MRAPPTAAAARSCFAFDIYRRASRNGNSLMILIGQEGVVCNAATGER